ncbi:MAG: hypothetical protein C0467_03740 [Planctomycetaceae bacterium]|nr:hypothetical protein [Planctomycetaceae bacterium]
MKRFLTPFRSWLGIAPPLDLEFANRVECVIEHVEAGCGAEIVLAVEPWSGSYRDINYLVGAVCSFGVLIVILHSHIEVHPDWIPLELILVFVLGSALAHRTVLRRWLTTTSRRERQVQDAAKIAFLDGVIGTPARTGILIFWSRLEQRILAIADRGVERQMPGECWAKFLFELRQLQSVAEPQEGLLKAIQDLGTHLSRHVPIPAKHVRVLPNRPRGE